MGLKIPRPGAPPGGAASTLADLALRLGDQQAHTHAIASTGGNGTGGNGGKGGNGATADTSANAER